MEWVLLGAVVVAVVVWRLGRPRPVAPPAPGPPPPVRSTVVRGDVAQAAGTAAAASGAATGAAEVLRRSTDPDDPAGAFMDGYVSGRWAQRDDDLTPADGRGWTTHDPWAARDPHVRTHADPGNDEDEDDDVHHDPFDDDMSDEW